MLILSKSIISLILGFVLSIILGIIIIPLLKKSNVSQNVSKTLNERHLLKNGTPTMGGLIFIISTLAVILVLFLNQNIHFSFNFIIILVMFLCYGLLGFSDDYLKIVMHNNKGLSILSKFLIEIILASIFFIIYLLCDNNTVLSFFNFNIDIGFFYGLFILFLLVGTSNAVNITDGLDGLCAGLCAISFITYGIIAWKNNYIIGNEEIAIFCFCLSGSLLGFLFFNFYPAKVFMGDTGSLALGGVLASVCIILKSELSLMIIGLIYIIETLSSLLQIIAIRVFKRKIFLKSPLHHHLEELNYAESDIIKVFYTIGLIVSMVALIYLIWL